MARTSSHRHVPARPAGHDHTLCVADALSLAEDICRGQGARLTPIRRRVLELVWESHRPAGAYEILDRLNKSGRRMAPIAVYRALDFLMEQGLVHRLASRNAFIGCTHPAKAHAAQFLICERCETVTELEDEGIARAVSDGATRAGFSLSGHVIEAQGLCESCRRGAPAR
ncbi:MAG: transcriptional repressor [Alphaproteobacteria bacterium]|nr:transcriptional repressor [Alphaproteobacteria bacterium]